MSSTALEDVLANHLRVARGSATQKALARLIEQHHQIIPADQHLRLARKVAQSAGLDGVGVRMHRELAADVANLGLAKWQQHAEGLLRQHGVYERLAEIAHASVVTPAVGPWTWPEEPDPDEGGDRLPLLGWLLSRPLHVQITLLHPVLTALREAGYFLEDVSGEDIPDPVQSGSGVLLAVAIVLLVFISARAAGDSP